MPKPIPIFKGKVENGKLQLRDRENFDLWVGSLDGKEVDLTVGLHSDSRSIKQNNYLWGIVYEAVAGTTGFEPKEVHEIFKKKFLSYSKRYKGKEYRFTKSTKELNTLGFSEYIEKIKRFAASELNCYIPEPNEFSF